MAKGVSIHIGLNALSTAHYNGWDGKLIACEADANDMALIAASQGFQTTELLTTKATRETVIKAIEETATALKEGDIFLLTYSGHGGQVPDFNADEADAQDETWCLFDAQLIDDELYGLWAKFKKGVRILLLSDSCHSGTVSKVSKTTSTLFADSALAYQNSGFGTRVMPDEVALSTYLQNKKFYQAIGEKAYKLKKQNDVHASVKLISGCQDNQLSSDGTFNGLFTGALKRVWNDGKFKGNYSDFHLGIQALLPALQSPNLYNVGVPDPGFDSQKPFTI